MKLLIYFLFAIVVAGLLMHFIIWPAIQQKRFRDKMDLYMAFTVDLFTEAREGNEVAIRVEDRFLDDDDDEEDKISDPLYIKGGIAIGITFGDRITENDMIVWRKDNVIHTASALAQAILPKAPLCPFPIDASSFKIPDDEEEDDEEEGGSKEPEGEAGASGSKQSEGEAGALFANTILVPINFSAASLMRSVIWPSPTAGEMRLDIDEAAEGYLVTPEYLTYALVDEKIAKVGRATFWIADGRVMWTNALSKELAEDFKLEMDEAPQEIKDMVVQRHAAARISEDTGWDNHIKEHIVNLQNYGYSINVYE